MNCLCGTEMKFRSLNAGPFRESCPACTPPESVKQNVKCLCNWGWEGPPEQAHRMSFKHMVSRDCEEFAFNNVVYHICMLAA